MDFDSSFPLLGAGMLPRRLSAVLVLSLALVLPCTLLADDWPQWLGPQRDGVWRETGILESLPSQGLKVRWRAPVGMGYAGPAVAEGRVYVTDRVLDAGTENPESGFAMRKTVGG